MQTFFFVFISMFFVSFTGMAQNGWNTFPKSNEKSESNVLGKEGILTDSIPVEKVNPQVSNTPGVVIVSVSPNIVAIDDQLKESAKGDPRINGYTILIFSGSGANSKRSAYDRQNEFKELFPDYVSHLMWKSPNYEVRVGDFRTKIEAEKVLQDVKQKYPSAIVRADKIELPELEGAK